MKSVSINLVSFMDDIRLKWGEDASYRIIQESPAGLEEIESIEAQIGRRIPVPIRDFFLECSRHFEFHWSVDNDDLPNIHGYSLDCGKFALRLDDIADAIGFFNSNRDWLRRSEGYFPIYRSSTGDILVIHHVDNAVGMYLGEAREEAGELSALQIEFEELLTQWSTFGFAGPQILFDFCRDTTTGALDLQSMIATQYRTALRDRG